MQSKSWWIPRTSRRGFGVLSALVILFVHVSDPGKINKHQYSIRHHCSIQYFVKVFAGGGEDFGVSYTGGPPKMDKNGRFDLLYHNCISLFKDPCRGMFQEHEKSTLCDHLLPTNQFRLYHSLTQLAPGRRLDQLSGQNRNFDR